MSKLSKALVKMNRVGKKLKPFPKFSDDPKRAKIEKKLYKLMEKGKKEGNQ